MIYHNFAHGQRVKAGAHYGTITGILEKDPDRYTFMVVFDHHAARGQCADFAGAMELVTMAETLKSPFPAFGGKSAIAPLVWERFGTVDNLVEPFVNSAAVALGCPYIPPHETWNDLNGFVANFWRATQADSDAVARAADWIIHEADLHARHAWLVRQQDDLAARLMGDPDYYDAKIAGWWLWGICQWIGSGWCSGQGPWMVNAD